MAKSGPKQAAGSSPPPGLFEASILAGLKVDLARVGTTERPCDWSHGRAVVPRSRVAVDGTPMATDGRHAISHVTSLIVEAGIPGGRGGWSPSARAPNGSPRRSDRASGRPAGRPGFVPRTGHGLLR